ISPADAVPGAPRTHAGDPRPGGWSADHVLRAGGRAAGGVHGAAAAHRRLTLVPYDAGPGLMAVSRGYRPRGQSTSRATARSCHPMPHVFTIRGRSVAGATAPVKSSCMVT